MDQDKRIEYESQEKKPCKKDKKSLARKENMWRNCSTRHILLKFLYMGWEYRGYATQIDTEMTVEEHVINALKRCCLIRERETSNYHRCGRTDAGVSAFSQVISIDVRSKLTDPSVENCNEEFEYCKMLNRLLPVYIRCYSWAHVENGVSSRFDCTSRSYNYFFPRGSLDIAGMQKAAKYLEGSHDFRNLCKMDVGNGVVEFIRTVDAACIEPHSTDEGGFQMMKFTVKSRGFLWHQIRCIMGVLLLVGERHEEPEIIERLLNVEETPCKPQYHMASALPLSLAEAEYDKLDLTWNSSKEEVQYLCRQLEELWTEHAIKATLARESLRRISRLTENPLPWQRQTGLFSGVVAKTHIPLLQRATCQSLEERIDTVQRKKMRLELDHTTDDSQKCEILS